MPFVQRVVEPIYISKQPLPIGLDNASEAISNNTLCGALRQLASLVSCAQNIFDNLTEESRRVFERAEVLKKRITRVQEKVKDLNAKNIPVPEGDLTQFSQIKIHYATKQIAETNLFTPDTRPSTVQRLYAAAVATPVPLMTQLDRFREDGLLSSCLFLCTPVVGGRAGSRKKTHNIDIETRRPASLVHLREWRLEDESTTSLSSPYTPTSPVINLDPNGTSHQLPSPEEKTAALVLRFPPQVVMVDVSGTQFQRMEKFRRSLVQLDFAGKKRKKHRSNRRNTITGTDVEEIREALMTQRSPGSADASDQTTEEVLSAPVFQTSSLTRHDSKKCKRTCLPSVPLANITVHCNPQSLPSSCAAVVSIRENIYEAIPDQQSKITARMNRKVKLREGNSADDATRSSSGNWSASSSTRESLESDTARLTGRGITSDPGSSGSDQDSAVSESTGPHPASTSSSSQPLGNKPLDSSFCSSSHTCSEGEGTLTPELQDIPFMDDETSSAYSCDTEGYYTSFHMDSGLKTLREDGQERGGSQKALNAENEYELYGHGSTSTTTSSAGTVVQVEPCSKNPSQTATRSPSPQGLPHPPSPPPRISSLERTKNKNKNRDSIITVIEAGCSDSRDGGNDSGRETSSSPMGSTSPRDTQMASPSEGDYSESDLEGVERQERLRSKTEMTVNRIPSLCVVTPPLSDDESVISSAVQRALLTTQFTSSTTSNSQYINKPLTCTEVPKLQCQLINSSILPRTRSYDKKAETTTKSICVPLASSGNAFSKGLFSYTHVKKVPSDPLIPDNSAAIKPTLKRESNYLTMDDLKKMQDRHKEISISAKGFEASHDSSPESVTNIPPLAPKLRCTDYISLSEIPRYTTQRSFSPLLAEGEKRTDMTILQKIINPGVVIGSPDSGISEQKLVYYNHTSSPANSLERNQRKGARVKLDSDGRVVFSTDSSVASRHLNQATTFEPGPNVREIPPSPVPHRIPKQFIRPVATTKPPEDIIPPPVSSQSSNYTLIKIGSPPPQRPTVVASTGPTSPIIVNRPGAYVNMQSNPPDVVKVTATSPPTSAGKISGQQFITNVKPPIKQDISPTSAAAIRRNESYRMANTSVLSLPKQDTKIPDIQLTTLLSDKDKSPIINPNVQGRRFYGARVVVDPNLLATSKPSTTSKASRGVAADETPSFYRHSGSGMIVPSPPSSPATYTTDNIICTSDNASVPAKSWQLHPPSPARQPHQVPSYYPQTQNYFPEQNRPLAYTHQYGSLQLVNKVMQPSQNQYIPTTYQTLPNKPFHPYSSNTSSQTGHYNLHSQTSILQQSPSSLGSLSSISYSPSPLKQSASLLSRSQPSVYESRLNSNSEVIRRHRTSTPIPCIPAVLTKPKTSRSSEELYATLHDLKKKLSISYDKQYLDTASRSPSPASTASSGSTRSSSIASSNSSWWEGSHSTPATPTSQFTPGDRRSWSPMTSSIYSDSGPLNKVSPTANKRMSWASSDRTPTPLLIKPTSIDNFKRLLLQHGKSNSKERVSAVELLKANKNQSQQRSSPSKRILSMQRSTLPSEFSTTTRLNQIASRLGSKRFLHNRSDVLSTPIQEEERWDSSQSECSPEQKQSKGSSDIFSCVSARRQLPFSSNNSEWNKGLVTAKLRNQPQTVSSSIITPLPLPPELSNRFSQHSDISVKTREYVSTEIQSIPDSPSPDRKHLETSL